MCLQALCFYCLFVFWGGGVASELCPTWSSCPFLWPVWTSENRYSFRWPEIEITACWASLLWDRAAPQRNVVYTETCNLFIHWDRDLWFQAVWNSVCNSGWTQICKNRVLGSQVLGLQIWSSISAFFLCSACPLLCLVTLSPHANLPHVMCSLNASSFLLTSLSLNYCCSLDGTLHVSDLLR